MKMKGSEIVAYTERFSNPALLCPGMVTPKSKKVERYIWGLTPPTQGDVLATNPLTFDSAKRLAQILIDHGDRQDPVAAVDEPANERWKEKVLE